MNKTSIIFAIMMIFTALLRMSDRQDTIWVSGVPAKIEFVKDTISCEGDTIVTIRSYIKILDQRDEEK